MAGRPGQSNDRDPVKRAIENSLIREMRVRSRIKSMGFPTGGNDAKIRQLKKRLTG